MILKKVYIIHGWEAKPKHGWYPWLKKQLEAKGYAAEIPAMPNTDEPTIEEWTSYMKKQIGKPDEKIYFVGHSMGCQSIIRYLEKFEKPKIGGMVLVAPWVSLTPAAFEDGGEEIVRPWIETPINWKNARDSTKNIVAIYSDSDPYVLLSDSKIFKEKLNAEIIIEHEKGHFDEDHDIIELPIVLEKILSF